MSRLSPDERREHGRRFADLVEQGVSVAEIAQRFGISQQTVRRRLVMHDMPLGLAMITQTSSLLDPAYVRMLHAIRDEIRAADALAIQAEVERGRQG